MNTMLVTLPSWSNILLVPFIMLITAASVAIIVVGIKLLIRLILKLIQKMTGKGDKR